MKIALDKNNGVLAFGFEDDLAYKNVIEAELPNGNFFKPIWKSEKKEWVEGLSKEAIEKIKESQKEGLTDVQALAQQITELELANIEKDNEIAQIKEENKILGQQSTDYDLRIIELEVKLNV